MITQWVFTKVVLKSVLKLGKSCESRKNTLKIKITNIFSESFETNCVLTELCFYTYKKYAKSEAY